jgi:predicted PurR-regulated permease PerM
MIAELIVILFSSIILAIVGVPIVNWLDKAKKEMEEHDGRTNQP